MDSKCSVATKHLSVFQLPVRTNNDVEGWYQRLNRKVIQKNKLPFYFLLSILYAEAKFVNIKMTLVSQSKLKKYQQKKYRRVQGILKQ